MSEAERKQSLKPYVVVWSAECYAESPLDAATQAYVSLIEDPRHAALFTTIDGEENRSEINIFEEYLGEQQRG